MSKVSAFGGRVFVNASENNRIKVWKLDGVLSQATDKNIIGTVKCECAEVGHLKLKYTACALREGGVDEGLSNSLVAVGDSVGRLVVFDVNSGRKRVEISASSNARADASAGHSEDSQSAVVHTRGGHHSRVNDVVFVRAPNGSLELYTCSSDKSICRWNANTGRLLESIAMDRIACKIHTVTARNHRFLFTGYNHISVIHASSKKKIALLQGHASQLRHLRSTKDCSLLVSGAQDRFLYVWKLKAIWKTFFMVASSLGSAVSGSSASPKSGAAMDPKKLKKLKKRLAKQSKTPKTSAHTLALDDTVLGVDVLTTADGKWHLIAAASKSAIYVWKLAASISKKGAAKSGGSKCVTLEPVCRILAEDASQRKDCPTMADLRYSWIRSFRFEDERHVVVCRGNASIAVFKRVCFALSEGGIDELEEETKSQASASGQQLAAESKDKKTLHFISEIRLGRVSVTSEEEKRALRGETATPFEVVAAATESVDLAVLGAADSALAAPSMLLAATGAKKRGKAEMSETDCVAVAGDSGADDGVASLKRVKRSSENVGATFGEKLAALESSTAVISDNLMSGKLSTFGGGLPTADSLAHLLTQSLVSDDTAMFESLLTVHSGAQQHEFDLIRNTLDEISPETATVLLGKLSGLFRTRPRRGMALMRWLVPLLNRHAAALSRDLGTRKDLVSIHQSVDYHTQTIIPAFKLHGRLALLSSQIQKVRKLQRDADVAEAIEIGQRKRQELDAERLRRKALFEHVEARRPLPTESSQKAERSSKSSAIEEDTKKAKAETGGGTPKLRSKSRKTKKKKKFGKRQGKNRSPSKPITEHLAL